jgi:hypothetical protein
MLRAGCAQPLAAYFATLLQPPVPALLFPRTGELRKALWKEFGLQGASWTIPAERMKGRLELHVPLPRQGETAVTVKVEAGNELLRVVEGAKNARISLSGTMSANGRLARNVVA